LNKELNIITLNIPFPPDYGGMIDTYYRIKALHDLGVIIHLHCFEYGRRHSPELESVCETITYYQRKNSILLHLSMVPFIVNSRKSKKLLDILLKNDAPILFDGLHTTYYSKHPSLLNRGKLVRMHNIEHRYYRSLAQNETNLIRKLFFSLESFKLKRYEKILENVKFTLAISESDQIYFNRIYKNSVLVPPAHPFDKVISLPGNGEYILFHGDLSVSENNIMASALISGVFSTLPFKCIIAGKNPPAALISKSSDYRNIRVIANPDMDEMQKLLLNAHINIVLAKNPHGFKLKLLTALYSGRHCIANKVITDNNSLASLCYNADTDEELINMIGLLMKKPFTAKHISEREKILAENYSNSRNMAGIIELIS
jgi:hypothetical protein